MDKDEIVCLLESGVDHVRNQRDNYDVHYLVFSTDDAIAARRWNYDDCDMNDDSGYTYAKIPKSDIEKLIEEAIAKGSAERVFDSENCFKSSARYSESPSYEEINSKRYAGKSKIFISVNNDEIKYLFIPSAPPDISQQALSIRLCKGEDYL